MKELIKVVKRPEPPKSDARTLAFIMNNKDQDLLAHIFIHFPHSDTKQLTLKYYQIKEVMLGRPKVDTAKVMITIGMKEVSKHMDKDELEIIILQK